jgi:predicted NUDIX family NTP pyrophosphohydrolase
MNLICAPFTVPEVDRAQWFRGGETLEKILPGQKPIVLKLFESLGVALSGN